MVMFSCVSERRMCWPYGQGLLNINEHLLLIQGSTHSEYSLKSKSDCRGRNMVCKQVKIFVSYQIVCVCLCVYTVL